MIWGGANEREAEGYVNATIEIDRLYRNESLIMIHAERRIEAWARAFMKKTVGG